MDQGRVGLFRMKNKRNYIKILRIGSFVCMLCFFSGAHSQSAKMKRQTIGACGTVYTANNSPWLIQQSIAQSGIIGTSVRNERHLIQGFIQPEIVQLSGSKMLSLQAIIYPNPFLTEFTISFERKPEKILFVEVFDLTGRPVMEKEFLLLQNISIPFPNAAAGIYVLRIRTANQFFTGQIIKL